MDLKVKRSLMSVLSLSVLASFALASACGGGGDETPTATATSRPDVSNTPQVTETATAVANSTPTVIADATPVPSSTVEPNGTATSQTPVPDDVDNFELTVKDGPGEGTYSGAYDDGFPICLEGGPSPVSVIYKGYDLDDDERYIDLTLLGSPDEPDQVVLTLRLSKGDDDNSYNVSSISSPTQGTGTVTVDEQPDVTTVHFTGASVEGPEIELTVECYPQSES